ncbi:MAG TPA: BadF/BadG/BcrA/BcrD ATPase family protein [Streptosporangiaceae bacterium]|jgi:N-acetylglucosamine kinase-like BadF-type ATPase
MQPEAKSLLVEGGGSHTWVMVADRKELWAEAWLPSLNRIGASEESQRSVLADVARAAGRFTDIDNALFAVGAACTVTYLSELAAIMTATLPATMRPPGRTYLMNDVVPLFFAEPDDCDQLVVIAGTGSGVAARSGFRAISRAGAHEYLLGDDGGAFDIGRHALRAVIARREERGPATALTERAERRTGGVEIDRFVYGAANPKQCVAEFARDVFAADQAGDVVAGEILSQAAACLAGVCRAALASAGLSAPIAATFTGSLLTEPTGGLRRRIEQQLLDLGVSTCRSAAVDIDLLRRTSQALRSDQGIFEAIVTAVPAIRL